MSRRLTTRRGSRSDRSFWHLVAALSLVSLGCDPAARHRAEVRDLALAAEASEQLTTAFGDSVAGGAPATPAASVAVRRDSLSVDPCTAGLGASGGLERMNLAPFPITIALPPGYAAVERRRRIIGRDTLEAEITRGSERMKFTRLTGYDPQAFHKGPPTDHCDDMVGGADAHIRVRTYGSQRTIYAVYVQPSGGLLRVEASLYGDQALGPMLAALRTVQFSFYWK